MNETLDDLVSATLQGLVDRGYSESVIAEHRRVYAYLSAFCKEKEITTYDETVGESFIYVFVSERYPSGTEKYSTICRYMRRLDCTLRDVEWIPEKTGRRAVPYVHSCYDNELAAYEA